jgi:hypothetical protein
MALRNTDNLPKQHQLTDLCNGEVSFSKGKAVPQHTYGDAGVGEDI